MRQIVFCSQGTWLLDWNAEAENSECRACEPGHFSTQIQKDDSGDTAICRSRLRHLPSLPFDLKRIITRPTTITRTAAATIAASATATTPEEQQENSRSNRRENKSRCQWRKAATPATILCTIYYNINVVATLTECLCSTTTSRTKHRKFGMASCAEGLQEAKVLKFRRKGQRLERPLNVIQCHSMSFNVIQCPQCGPGVCFPGTVQPAFSAEACQRCAAGTFAALAGQSTCDKCQQGHGSISNRDEDRAVSVLWVHLVLVWF